MQFSYELKLNEILKVIEEYSTKKIRLDKVQAEKEVAPALAGIWGQRGELDPEQMSVSEYSETSGTQSSSSSTPRKHKKHKKKNAKRKIREGSPIEEEMLLLALADLKPTSILKGNILWIIFEIRGN